MTRPQPVGRPSGSRTSADGFARALIEADRCSDASVRAVANHIPLAELVDVVIALASHANRTQGPLRTPRVEHNPNRPVPQRWTDERAREAHAAYARHHRDPWTVAGERHYQRTRRARGRKVA